ncbi:MAG: hypothetical protein K8I27_09015 [Planctomycetes bacterium]|nr:hypothetical protein [Planctomycetota bacterium]
MKTLSLMGGLVIGAALLAGCQDNSQEVDKLRSDLVAQQNRFDEANNKWASDRDTMRAEIDDLKARLGALDAEGTPAKPVAEQIKDLEGRIAGVEEKPDLSAKVDALGKKIDGVRDEAVEAARAEAAKAGAGAIDKDALAEALAKQQAANAPTKDLAQAMDRLEISDAEKEQLKQYIIDAKTQILETLEVPTEDGRVFAEELIDGFIKVQNGEAKETDIHALFLELGSKKIPGDINGRSYMEAINDIKALNKEDISRMLSEKDQKKLTTAHPDWTDFDVEEGDPWGALYMERLQKQQAEKGNGG